MGAIGTYVSVTLSSMVFTLRANASFAPQTRSADAKIEARLSFESVEAIVVCCRADVGDIIDRVYHRLNGCATINGGI